MHPARLTRFLSILILLTAVSGAAACGGQSNAVKANDAVNKGLAAHEAGNLDLAATQYREALKLDPQNKFAFYNLGLIAQTKGDAVAAENNYRIAMSIDPAFTPPVYNLAVLRRDGGNLQEAVTLYRQVIAIDANNAAAHFNLGLVLQRLGQTAEGNAAIQHANSLDPRFGQPAPAATPAVPAPAATPAAPAPVSAPVPSPTPAR
jgi:tetratricopeptide (TPR) repeat protein